ncbi:ParB/RepB/Spo0J family partition protein [Alloyangia pacifica]|uniref:ParB/RepB/Spo0J family partition protein n=1 Tax=Alloyangia pacifica TaxID=311180 RepID=UPI001CFE924E|nr:ParB/RepB/Spo0J family partition protein [Alloyangia pacifica]
MAPKKFNSTTETLDRLAASGQLSALMRKNAPLPPAQREMPLEEIVADPEQPRRHFDEEQLASLSASIKAQGILQAITVQPSDEDGKHRIIMGERRFQAAQRAGLKTIPVVIREMTAELRMAQLTENVQRADLTTLEVAEAVAAMRAAGQSRSAIADALGWSEAAISRFAALAQMPEELRAAAAQNVTIRTLSDLHALWKDDAEAVRVYLAETDPTEISRASVAALKSSIASGSLGTAAQSPSQPTIEHEEVPHEAVEAQGLAMEVHPLLSEVGETDHPSGPPELSDQTLHQPSLPGTAQPSAQAPKAAEGGSVSVTLVARHGDRLGEVLLERAASSPTSVLVSFREDEIVEEIALSELELVEVRRS